MKTLIALMRGINVGGKHINYSGSAAAERTHGGHNLRDVASNKLVGRVQAPVVVAIFDLVFTRYCQVVSQFVQGVLCNVCE